MYQILVTGHGGFPSGIQSALRYLMGDNPNLSILELSEGMTHKQYEAELSEFFEKPPPGAGLCRFNRRCPAPDCRKGPS